MIKLFSFCLAIGAMSLCANGHTEDLYRVSRYALLEPVATAEQVDVLSVVVSVDFTDRVETVGDAIEHLLQRSGYRLADLRASDPALSILLSLPLPLVHRSLGPIRIDHALIALAGPAWDLVVDPVNRLISFDLLEEPSMRPLPDDAVAQEPATF